MKENFVRVICTLGLGLPWAAQKSWHAFKREADPAINALLLLVAVLSGLASVLVGTYVVIFVVQAACSIFGLNISEHAQFSFWIASGVILANLYAIVHR